VLVPSRGPIHRGGQEAQMKPYVLLLAFLSFTECIPPAFSAGCLQDDQTVSTPSSR
jgi:hypothetical protein